MGDIARGLFKGEYLEKIDKAHHPEGFEPTTLRLRGASFTAVQQPLTHQKLV